MSMQSNRRPKPVFNNDYIGDVLYKLLPFTTYYYGYKLYLLKGISCIYKYILLFWWSPSGNLDEVFTYNHMALMSYYIYIYINNLNLILNKC